MGYVGSTWLSAPLFAEQRNLSDGGSSMVQQYASQPPARKRRRWPLVLGVLGVVFFAGVGGCAAILGSVGNEVDKAVQQQNDRGAPRAVTLGKAFTIGNHETLAGWKVTNEAGMFSVAAKVRNVSDTTSTAFLHVKLLSAAGEVLGNVQCNSGDLEPGQTETLNCIPDGSFGTFQKLTAEATF
ncbi:hypothetical protein EV643_14116 [Kribbella sp. VKM Ac-2527]|uniref:Uncharacterized protein n=1 Tax=Kribbella caucasensis TaxID=2512215 RepID=A0A4R6J5C9_9ACTN|nr:hypothetical protein EV643_14116 [Kribbella sp. VKM Ac-2527]